VDETVKTKENAMKIILFVNDSFFSYLLARPLIDKYHADIALVVLSTRVQSSLSQVVKIFRKSSLEYFCYRSTIQAFSMLNGFMKRKTVDSLSRRHGITRIRSQRLKKNIENISEAGPFDIGFAFNFDQIIGSEIFGLCENGIINIHASKLPNDKGISPVLWAFARGDEEIWSSIYKMDEGIDTGPIAEQIRIPVDKDSTAFSLYKKVCIESGKRLVHVLEKIKKGECTYRQQVNTGGETYWSWPDDYHAKLLKRSNRRLISISDALTILK